MQRFSVFAHLSSPKVDDYRRVLTAFAKARAQFVIHLRPAEVARESHLSEEAIHAALDQLVEWGNLDRSHDYVDAATVEEFYRVKWLYQLSARGEAAERALETFEESLHQPGELQTEALRDIANHLESIRLLLVGDADEPKAVDHGKLHQQFRELSTRFEEFTVQAQRFMQFLQSTIELRPTDCGGWPSDSDPPGTCASTRKRWPIASSRTRARGPVGWRRNRCGCNRS